MSEQNEKDMDRSRMKIYYKILGGHTHCRVFMNGGKCGDKCGDLCFRNEEFVEFREHCPWIQFVEDVKDVLERSWDTLDEPI